jgi:hypothetical protein
MVGTEGLEPPTSTTSMWRSSQLSYVPASKSRRQLLQINILVYLQLRLAFFFQKREQDNYLSRIFVKTKQLKY